MNDKLVVGIADMKMAQGSGMLVTYALGSCIGICFYDPMLKLAALLHIMLPLNLETGRKSPLKYADTGIRETLREMERRGAKRARVTAKSVCRYGNCLACKKDGNGRRPVCADESQNCRRSPHV